MIKEKKKITYEDGTTYEGSMTDGIYNGQGTITWTNGASYKGEWKNGSFHGQGILREVWGDIYIGGFKNNKAHGYGRQDFFESDGYFEGEVKNDYLNGKGTYLSANGCKSERQISSFGR